VSTSNRVLGILVVSTFVFLGMLLVIVTKVEVKQYGVENAPMVQRHGRSVRKNKISRNLKKEGDDRILHRQKEKQKQEQKLPIEPSTTPRQLMTTANLRPGWTKGPEIPFEFIESSCCWHAAELWCVGGYQNAETASYNPHTNSWTMRPSMAIKIEHIFNTAVSANNGKTLAVIGGVGFPPKGKNNNKPFKVRIQLLDTHDVPPEEMKWRVGDDETESSGMDIGGISTCTIAPVAGEYYCVFGSDYNFIRTDTMRFFAFHPGTMRFRQLPEPPAFYSHVTLLADEVRKRVIYLASRIVRKKLQTDEPSRTTYFYDVEKNEWNLDEPQEIPDYMPSLEGRTAYQHPSTLYAYLMGGQNNAGSWVSELIYKVSLSEDPADRDVRFEWWSRLPGAAKFGSSVRNMPDDSAHPGKLIMVGGGCAVGPFPVNEVWFWDERKHVQSETAYHLQRKTPGDNRPQPKHTVLAATFGVHDVTHRVQELLDEGWTYFNTRSIPDFRLLDHWQWWLIKRKPLITVTKVSNGKKYRTGWPLETLSITLLEDDGWVRMVFCAKGSGCKISFWEEEKEYKIFHKLNHFPQWEFPNPKKAKIQ